MSNLDSYIDPKERVSQDLLVVFDKMEKSIREAYDLGLDVTWQRSNRMVFMDTTEKLEYYWPKRIDDELKSDPDFDDRPQLDRNAPQVADKREEVSNELLLLCDKLNNLLNEAEDLGLVVELVTDDCNPPKLQPYVWERIFWPRSASRELITNPDKYQHRLDFDWAAQSIKLTGKKER